ncbi:helix-turn-helix transcriptional regulator [Humidesulfovibrio mexicanus]|nr:helix-turn-helix domain-containing protein [Humidesulfovibrio mexicanus]
MTIDAAASHSPGRNRRQVCASLGCSRSMFYVLLDRGEFPNAYFVGGSVRVPQSDVDAYKARNNYVRKKDAEAG